MATECCTQNCYMSINGIVKNKTECNMMCQVTSDDSVFIPFDFNPDRLAVSDFLSSKFRVDTLFVIQ